MTIKITPTQHRALVSVSKASEESPVTFGDRGCHFGFMTGHKLQNLKLLLGSSKMVLTGQTMRRDGDIDKTFHNRFSAHGLTDLGKSTLKEIGDNPRRKSDTLSKPMKYVITTLPVDGSGFAIFAARTTLDALCKRGLIESDVQKWRYNLTEAGIAKRKTFKPRPGRKT